MKPTIGRIVIYHTCAMDQRMISEHPFNTPQEQSPAIVVFVGEDDTVNLKVFVDGHGDFYKKNIEQGDQPGQWNWPVIEKTAETPKTEADESLFKISSLLTGYQKFEADGQILPNSGNVEHPVSESLAKKLDQFSEGPQGVSGGPGDPAGIRLDQTQSEVNSQFLANAIAAAAANIKARQSDNGGVSGPRGHRGVEGVAGSPVTPTPDNGLIGITGLQGDKGPAGMPQIEIMGSDGPTTIEGNPNVQIIVADDIDQQQKEVNVPVFEADKKEVTAKTSKK